VVITSEPDPTAKTILRPTPASKRLQKKKKKWAFNKGPTFDFPVESDEPNLLRPVLSSTPSPIANLLGSSSPRFRVIPVGGRIEVSAAAFQIARKVGEMIGGNISDSEGQRKGCGLIVDYGAPKAFGSSFRVGGLWDNLNSWTCIDNIF